MLAASYRLRRRATALCATLSGLMGLVLLSLLGLNVGVRLADINLPWMAETTRIVFMWGIVIGVIAVSLSSQHFRVDVFNLKAVDEAEPGGMWELVLQLIACAALAYVLYYAIPSIARASSQVFASVPLTYGTMRLALTVGLGGMLIAHLWRAAEIVAELADGRPLRQEG
jgi:TRAP-type C4-dicarboxylate transport system permease small subunit